MCLQKETILREYKRGEEVIVEYLRALGLDARTEDGWVYVDSDEGQLWIGAEYGASLDADVRKPAKV